MLQCRIVNVRSTRSFLCACLLPSGSSRTSAVFMDAAICGEHFPKGNEHCCNNRPDDEAVCSKGGKATKSGNKHDVVRNLGVLPDQNWPQQVVNEANDDDAEM